MHFLFILFKDFFLEQFEVHRKIDGKVQRFPSCPAPTHTCITAPTNIPHQNGTLVTTEPSLTHYHPKSTVHIMVHSWCYMFYGSVRHFQNIFIKHIVSGFSSTPFLFLGFRTMCAQYCISFADVEKARINIQDFIHLTPVLTSSILNQETGRNLFFKCELFQKTGSFKVTILFDSVLCIFSNVIHI